MSGGRLVIVSHRSSHHAKHSGYAPLASHLTCSIISARPRRFPPWRVRRLLARGGPPVYTSESVGKETDLLRVMLGGHGVAHFLNGEHDFRYTRYWAGALRWSTVATFHYPPGQLRDYYAQSPHALRGLDAALCVSTSQCEVLSELTGHRRVWFVPLGVDSAWFTPPESRNTQRPTALFVGQHMRDFDLLGRVLPPLKQRFPDLTCVAVLRADHRHLLPPIDWIDARCGIDDEQLRELYRTASCLLLPLQDATANCAVVEAMACALPIVSTDIGGVRDYVGGDAALLCAPGSAAAMIEACTHVLTDSGTAARLGAAGRRRALALDWTSIASTVREIYEREFGLVLDQQPHPGGEEEN